MTIGDRLGRYQLEQELGAGGMATVYRARDTELRREVAVKVLFQHLCRSSETVARFQREARAAASLDHPHILRVYDVGGAGEATGAELGDPPYIVLELVKGPNLDESTDTPPIAEVIAAIGAVVAEALAHAHAAGVIHRDVKPANLLWADGGRVVLADFGVARVVSDDESLVTRTGSVLGTPAFMSPEQATGAKIDARSDLYSLGATLYRLATGSLPVSGGPARAAAAIAAGEIVPPLRRNPAMGRPLARVIERLMHIEPEMRYANAEQAARALRDVVALGCDRDPETLIVDHAADRVSCESAVRTQVVDRYCTAAKHALADGETARGLALADRVLALDPDNPRATELIQGAGRRRALRTTVGGAAVAGLLGLVGYLAWPSSSPQPVEAAQGSDAAAIAMAAPALDAALAPGVVIMDAAPVAEDPDAAATRSSPARPVRRPPRRRIDAAPEPDSGARAIVLPTDPIDAAPPPARRGRLVIDPDVPWCNLTIDGTSHGQIRGRESIDIAVGRHTVVCAQGALASWSGTARVKAGETTRIAPVLLAKVAVTVAVKGGDAVRIGGVRHPNGATVSVRPGQLNVEVLRQGVVVDRAWVSVSSQAKSCQLRDKPQLGCFR